MQQETALIKGKPPRYTVPISLRTLRPHSSCCRCLPYPIWFPTDTLVHAAPVIVSPLHPQLRDRTEKQFDDRDKYMGGHGLARTFDIVHTSSR